MDNPDNKSYNRGMQFDIDISSPQAACFMVLRDLILSYTEIHEYKTAKQTTYKDSYSTVCMLRVRQNRVRLTFANGAKMQERFEMLLGAAKIVRYLEYRDIQDIDTFLLHTMIAESLLINMEKHELQRLRCGLKRY